MRGLFGGRGQKIILGQRERDNFLGEAKRKRKLRDRVLSEFPYCIYCGGTVGATTLEHLPPKIVFQFKHRPSGLEFPACSGCNSGSRLDDQAVAMFARLYPDPTTEAASAELQKLMKEVDNNHPGLLKEMQPSFRQLKIARRKLAGKEPNVGAINCQGPLLNRIMHRFGAKIGYALHFEYTKSAVPTAGACSTWWVTNYQRLEGYFPDELLQLMGEPKTLKQGKIEVSDQFQYGSIGTKDGSMTAHFASFRFSFAVFAFTAVEAGKVTPPEDVDHFEFHRPGWLKT